MSSLTLTIVANMTSNYGEGLGNISSVQKVFRNGKVYATRSRESLKNAVMVQSGFYDDLKVTVTEGKKAESKVNQKVASEEINVSNCRALEGGYMNTIGKTVVRNSSFYFTDAVACEPYVNENRFHNNLFMAQTYAKDNELNLQNDAGNCGLMPYQYEYDKSLKQYSVTIDLDMIGKDDNFEAEADKQEKADRVIALLDAIKNLSLVVKGNLDNAEPIFVIGGITNRKTHTFENAVKVKQNKLEISEGLKDKITDTMRVGLLKGSYLENEREIESELHSMGVEAFFKEMETQVKKYYEV